MWYEDTALADLYVYLELLEIFSENMWYSLAVWNNYLVEILLGCRAYGQRVIYRFSQA